MYRKLALLKGSVFRTSLILCLALLALIFIVWRRWATIVIPDNDSGKGNLILESWRLLVVIMVLASLGALVSAATNLRERDRKIRVPDQLVGNTLMAIRPPVGCERCCRRGRLAVWAVQRPDGEWLDGLRRPVAAGFAERLVTRVVDSAAAGASR